MRLKRTRWLRPCILVLGLLLLHGSRASVFPDRYDDQIRKAAEHYMPVASAAFGWQILKAQYFQESRLTANARSPVGAAGVAQFMPATWRDVSARMGLPDRASPYMPRYAIDAGAWYMHSLRAVWTAPRPEHDRHSLALASYNAGTGNILKAQRLAGGANRACPVLAELPNVTGTDNSRQTQTYVTRIWRYWRAMTVAGDR